MRPSGTSSCTVGCVKANGKATYSASFSNTGVLVISFSMSTQGSASYSVTVDVAVPQPSTVRVVTSRTPMPGKRSERVAVAARPQRRAIATAHVDQLVQPAPGGRLDPLLAVGPAERLDRARGGVEADAETARLGVGGGPFISERRGRAVTLGEGEVAQTGDVGDHHQGVAVRQLHGG